jgi:hypothetical protein
MMELSNGIILSLESIVNGSLFIKGSVYGINLSYVVFGISKTQLLPHAISSYLTFDEAKEAIIQINLAMDYPDFLKSHLI